jgi:hypothetical protein
MRYLFVLLILASPVSAQNLKLHLHSGATVLGQSPIAEWTIKTKYGTLKIPTADMRSVSVGMHYDGDMKDRIAKATKRLGSEVYKEREAASRELVAFGKYAFPLMPKNGDMESNRRAEDVQKKILELDAQADKYSLLDTIRTSEFEVKGEIEMTEIVITHPDYEGPVTVKLSKIAKIQVQHKQNGELEVKADGQWHDTGFHSDWSDKFRVSGTGSVDLWPQGVGQYVATPKGYNTAGKGGQFMAGALIMKIGESGRPEYVGEGTSFTPSSAGNIYLFIVESPWNSPSSGSYRVTIKGE